jgi:hypothetical protein
MYCFQLIFLLLLCSKLFFFSFFSFRREEEAMANPGRTSPALSSDESDADKNPPKPSAKEQKEQWKKIFTQSQSQSQKRARSRSRSRSRSRTRSRSRSQESEESESSQDRRAAAAKKAKKDTSSEDEEEVITRENLLWQWFSRSDTEFSKSSRPGIDTQYAKAVCTIVCATREGAIICGRVIGRTDANSIGMTRHLKNRHPSEHATYRTQRLAFKVQADKGRRKVQEIAMEEQEYQAWRGGKHY